MKLECQHVSASEAGDEIFQLLFEAKPDHEDGSYVLVSRAFLEEDEGAPSPVYVETHDERLTGYHLTVGAELTRNRLTLRLPSPVDETIEVDFTTSDRNFQKARRILGIILQKDMGKDEKRDANHRSGGIRRRAGGSPKPSR